MGGLRNSTGLQEGRVMTVPWDDWDDHCTGECKVGLCKQWAYEEHANGMVREIGHRRTHNYMQIAGPQAHNVAGYIATLSNNATRSVVRHRSRSASVRAGDTSSRHESSYRGRRHR